MSSALPPSTFSFNNGLDCNTLTVNMNTIKDNILKMMAFQTPPPSTGLPGRPEFMAVVKNNSYSSDMLSTVYHLLNNDDKCPVDGFLVAHFAEARALRSCPQLDQVKLSAKKRVFAIYAEPEDYEELCSLGVETAVDNVERIELLMKAAKKVGKPARVHLHVNTGMNRLGCPPEDALDIAKFIITEGCEEGLLAFVGIKTQLSTADDFSQDFCFEQEHAFYKVIDDVLHCEEMKKAKSPLARLEVIHSQNTAWTLRYQPWLDEKFEKLDMKSWPRRMLRVGAGMYGYCTSELISRLDLQPAVTIRSKIASLHDPKPGAPISYARLFTVPENMPEGKTFRVATIPQGYGEGITKWPDHFVCIRGKKCPIIGKITMDFIMADVTELGDDVKCGDSVLILGKEDRVDEPNAGCEIDAHAAGLAQGTSSGQFLARGGYRLKRIYLDMK